MESVKWKIYYSDKTTFDNTQGLPEDAPTVGVICIKHFIEGGWRIQAFTDFYIWEVESEWWGADQAGFWQYMFKPGIKIVKIGTNIKDEPFKDIMKLAREDTTDGMPIIT